MQQKRLKLSWRPGKLVPVRTSILRGDSRYSSAWNFEKLSADRYDTRHSSLPDVIRFENLGPDQSLDELRFVTQGRVLCIRTMLYRPFIYFATHFRHLVPESSDLAYRLQDFVTKGLNICVALNSGNAMTHRHHGTWYGLRESVASSMTLLAAEMGGLTTTSKLQIALPDGGVAEENQYQRAIQLAIEKLRYWEAEASPDIARGRALLEELTASAR